MFIAALLYTDLQLDPLEKYFLVRFAQCFGVSETAAAGVKVLAQQFWMADQQVTAALKTLISYNILSCMPAEHRRGRPKAKYKISKTFALELSGRKPEGEVCHSEMLSRLFLNKDKSTLKAMADLRPGLSTESKMAALRERRDFSQLGTINRLLLCVLLAHADRFGAVRNLSTAAICNMTGLTREKLKHRVQRLREQGFICHYVAGATSGTIIGRMKSVYFLDLCHPQIRGLTFQPEKLVVSRWLHESEPYDQALSTYHDVVLYAKSASLNHRFSRLVKIKRLFPKRNREHRCIAPLLQCRIESYASFFLSDWRDEPQKKRSTEIASLKTVWPGLFDQISNELQVLHKHPLPAPEVSLERDHQLLTEHIFEEAYRLAWMVREAILHTGQIFSSSKEYMTLPGRYGQIDEEFFQFDCTILALPTLMPTIQI